MISIPLAGAWPAVRSRFGVNSWFCPAHKPTTILFIHLR